MTVSVIEDAQLNRQIIMNHLEGCTKGRFFCTWQI